MKTAKEIARNLVVGVMRSDEPCLFPLEAIEKAIEQARREVFEAGYRDGWEDGADHQSFPSEWPDLEEALPIALECAGLTP